MGLGGTTQPNLRPMTGTFPGSASMHPKLLKLKSGTIDHACEDLSLINRPAKEEETCWQRRHCTSVSCVHQTNDTHRGCRRRQKTLQQKQKKIVLAASAHARDRDPAHTSHLWPSEAKQGELEGLGRPPNFSVGAILTKNQYQSKLGRFSPNYYWDLISKNEQGPTSRGDEGLPPV